MRTAWLILLLGWLPWTGAVGQPESAPSSPLSFHTVDVFIDSGNRHLAVYQVEVVVNQGARIVGIEGGEVAAFSEPPHYDPRAIQGNRVILGAFSTLPTNHLPKGLTRVATLHVQTQGEEPPQLEIREATAADQDGKKIKVKANTTIRTRKRL